MFYHARATLKPRSAKSSPITAFEVDLSRDAVLRNIAIPFLQKDTFYCGGTVVGADTVEGINFNETDQESSELLPFILAARSRSGILSVSDPKLQVTFKGRDVTREILDQATKEIEAARPAKAKAAGSTDWAADLGTSMTNLLEKQSSRVFVVHGHDIPALEQTELLLRRWGLEPVIVRDKANRGMTVIEKVEANSDVGYAIILLTPDDVGRSKGGDEFPRARQNVVWEWGYLVAKLGRRKVACLRKGHVELPSDLHGIVWIDVGDDIKSNAAEIARELRAAGTL